MSDAKKALEARNRFIAGVVKKDLERTDGDDDMLSQSTDVGTTELSDAYNSSTAFSGNTFSLREASEHVSDSHLM